MALIEGFRVQNYRALRDITLGRLSTQQNLEPLTPFTVVIGKNGVGKSTLFDAFGFVADCLSHDVETACDMKQRGGFDRLHSLGTSDPIKFEIYYREAAGERPITYELAIALDPVGRPFVESEVLKQRRKGQAHGRPFPFLRLHHGKGMVWAGEEAVESLGEEDRGQEPVDLTDLRQLGENQLMGWLQQRQETSSGMAVDAEAIDRATAANPKDLPKQQAALAYWLSKKYRVAPEPLAALVTEAYEIGKRTKLDPTLILAIIAIESSFNPFAQSSVGAQGLMQVMTSVHTDKYQHFGGNYAAFDPRTNLRVGVKVLQECVARAGSLVGGLKYYVGAANLPTDGGYAEYVAVPSTNAHRVSARLSDVEWATFPCAYSTAENMLHRAGLMPGETLVITGASGGVGTGLIQIGAARGARVVAITSAGKIDQARTLGASIALPRDDAALAESIKAAAGPVDVWADVVGGAGFPALFDTLRPGARYVTSGAIAGPIIEVDLRTLYLRDITMYGATMQAPEVFPTLLKRIEQGAIKPIVAKTYPLSRAREAQADFGAKAHVGKIVLVPGQ